MFGFFNFLGEMLTYFVGLKNIFKTILPGNKWKLLKYNKSYFENHFCI